MKDKIVERKIRRWGLTERTVALAAMVPGGHHKVQLQEEAVNHEGDWMARA